MLRLALAALLGLLLTAPLRAQAPPPADPADVASVGAILDALYDSISGPAGEDRDWDRFRSLFHPDARLMPTAPRPGGDTLVVWTPDEYVERSGPFLVRAGFAEREVGRTESRFGPVVHAFSAYEGAYTTPDGPQSVRGINSIQLFSDGQRWWILTVYWAAEQPDRPLPAFSPPPSDTPGPNAPPPGYLCCGRQGR